MKKYLLLLMLPLFMAFASCGEEEPLPVNVASVSIAPSDDFSLEIGETKALTASVQPSDADNKSITWASSNTAVATVTGGTVTAITAGEANISATSANGKSASVTVTVNAKVPEEPTPTAGIKFTDEKFKAALLAATGEYKVDTNDDGEITEEEAAKVKKINISGMGITSIEEIKYFTALEELDASNNELTSAADTKSGATLSFSQNINIMYLNLSGNKLTTVDISTNVKLTNLDISNNLLASLSVNTNVNLTQLKVNDNELTTLDVKSNAKIEILDVRNNRLTTIDITTNVSITTIAVGGQTTSTGISSSITVVVTQQQADDNLVGDKDDDDIDVETDGDDDGDDDGDKPEPEPDTELELSIDDKDVAAAAGGFNFNITANKAWTASGIPSWITLTPNKGEGDAIAALTYTANESTEEREVTITFTAGTGDDIETETLTIEQAGKDNGGQPDPEDPDSGEGSLENLEEEELQ